MIGDLRVLLVAWAITCVVIVAYVVLVGAGALSS
jgi:hypothetical protein